MPQLAYSQEMSEAFAGLLTDSRFHEIESMIALEAISFGFGVCASQANPTSSVKLPDTNNVVITDDAGTYTAGDIVATVNGTDVTESFDTDKNTTLTALAASIAALATVSTATYVAGSHTITVVAANDVDLTITVDVTGITGDMTISSIVGTCTDLVRGLAVHSHIANNVLPTAGSSSFTSVAYQANDAVSVLRKGQLWVEVADAVVADSAVYLITAGANKGKLTDSSSSPNILVPSAVFRSTTTAAGIAKVDINLPV